MSTRKSVRNRSSRSTQDPHKPLWKDVRAILTAKNQRVIEVPGDGHCFLQAVRQCLLHDHGINYSLFAIKNIIMNEIMDNEAFYSERHVKPTGPKGPKTILECAADYFMNRTYTQSVVDIVVAATANAFSMNFEIYCKQADDTFEIISQQSRSQNTSSAIYLLYNGVHYDAIVKAKYSTPQNVYKRKSDQSHKTESVHDALSRNPRKKHAKSTSSQANKEPQQSIIPDVTEFTFCTCCGKLTPVTNAVYFQETNYDFAQPQVACKLSQQNRLHLMEEEYICKQCHSQYCKMSTRKSDQSHKTESVHDALSRNPRKKHAKSTSSQANKEPQQSIIPDVTEFTFCTCCGKLTPVTNAVYFQETNYDFAQPQVACKLSQQNRLHLMEEEYICKQCHSQYCKIQYQDDHKIPTSNKSTPNMKTDQGYTDKSAKTQQGNKFTPPKSSYPSSKRRKVTQSSNIADKTQSGELTFCSCCAEIISVASAVLFQQDNYDFTDPKVADKLHPNKRFQMMPTEYLCGKCHHQFCREQYHQSSNKDIPASTSKSNTNVDSSCHPIVQASVI